MVFINKFLAYTTGLTSPVASVNGIDWLAQQNGGQFDPILFGDYRDPQDNILNNFEGFFNDAFLPQDFSSPFNTAEGTTYPAPKRDLIKEIEIQQNDVEDKQTVAKEELKKPHVPFENLWLVNFPCLPLPSQIHHLHPLYNHLDFKHIRPLDSATLSRLNLLAGNKCKAARSSNPAKSTSTTCARSSRPRRNARAAGQSSTRKTSRASSAPRLQIQKDR